MDYIAEFVDKRHKGTCIYCGYSLFGLPVNRDHVPTKCFLTKPYPENLPCIDAHVDCNAKFARDEEYIAAFLGTVRAGSTDQNAQIDDRARKILARSEKLRNRIESSASHYLTRAGEKRSVWNVELPRLERIIVKNARGHVYYEYGEPRYDRPDEISVVPLDSLPTAQREAFESAPSASVFPEVGSRMMTRILSGQDMWDSWVIVQDDVYRFAILPYKSGLIVRSVLFEYMATEVVWS